MSSIALDNPLDLRELFTTGSVLEINEEYDNGEHRIETEDTHEKKIDIFGEPVTSLEDLVKQLTPVDEDEYVKKKIMEEGGGLPLHNGCTVSVIYSAYFEGSSEPFDVNCGKPLVVNLDDSGLLPGLEIAVKSMLVGEVAVFVLSYQVMYGELGVPPRIKPKADCIFYIKLIKSLVTPEEGPINFSEQNIFQRVRAEVTTLFKSGLVLHKARNYSVAAQLFRKGVALLHKCRLADEEEEKIQQKSLLRLYLNLAVCYNKLKQPLKACISCNELNRLNGLWNNGKALYQNGMALRMIGQFDAASKRLQRALKLNPDNSKIQEEIALVNKLRDSCSQIQLIDKSSSTIGEDFKQEVERVVKQFKENPNLCKLTLPAGLNESEIEYIKSVCEKENLFCNKVQKNYLLDKETENLPVETDVDIFL
ncbi:inactive peptidyl-prolyl cis-trans isomerase shutdown-like isoform X1 [Aricia agestis]|uniref:inactive peptidyl-prolyl cis-trans isomerase shutdown-like isoform X1 n=1 Tax=Aricia agestis TaxID=91739 RepID=UPI001C2038F4|nr:inactive peptidyl-prolyl cis-trans isomerase shutdown-like isoform X1 [Aricia agestis]